VVDDVFAASSQVSIRCAKCVRVFIVYWTFDSFAEEGTAMSPTYFEVERARLNREVYDANRAGDLPRLQEVLQGLTVLFRAYYGAAS